MQPEHLSSVASAMPREGARHRRGLLAWSLVAILALGQDIAGAQGSTGSGSSDLSQVDPSFAGTRAEVGGAADGPGPVSPADDNAPVKLRNDDPRNAPSTLPDPVDHPRDMATASPKLSEFERFVLNVTGVPVKAFGRDLANTIGHSTIDFSPQVPPDYIVSVGDELAVSIWGSVDANLRVTVDRAGRITIPRVGTLLVAGTRYDALQSLIQNQAARVFHNFELSVTLGKLRSVRVFVTGFVEKPGAYAVSSLSTVSGAILRAGGTGAIGSLRDIRLIRHGVEIAHVDLYKVLLDGDRSGDVPVFADDVIQVAAVGPQVALLGSVNNPAAFEILPSESVADVLKMAGGFTSLADRSRLIIQTVRDRADTGVRELALPANLTLRPSAGDIYRAISLVATTMPLQRQNKTVKVEGEVERPGEYVLPPNSTTQDAITAAGGLTPLAYVYGMELTRESTRRQQAMNYDRALRDLETQFTLTEATRHQAVVGDATAHAANLTTFSALFTRLREIRPTGRIVLQLQPDEKVVPRLSLEAGDQILIPPHPTTVGVFGSVFNGGSFLYKPDRSLKYYLDLAGGPTPGAFPRGAFVIRPNGSVISVLQYAHWFSTESPLERFTAEAGDTIFVPEELDKSTWTESLKDWTQILYQSALGFAALKTIQ